MMKVSDILFELKRVEIEKSIATEFLRSLDQEHISGLEDGSFEKQAYENVSSYILSFLDTCELELIRFGTMEVSDGEVSGRKKEKKKNAPKRKSSKPRSKKRT